MGNEKEFTITTINNSKDNIYVQSVKLNGKDYDKSYILFEDIKAGGTLEFTMGAEPSETFGIAEQARP